MRTTFAYGRMSLPLPTITTSTGTIQGNGDTYYFWITARNRVGFNNASPVRSIVLTNNSSITLSATNFTQLDYEDWQYFVISVSKTNDYSTSRIIYRQNAFTPQGVFIESPSNFSIDSNYVLNGNVNISALENLPTEVPNGFRVRLTFINRAAEFVANSLEEPNNLTIFEGVGGNWHLVASNSLVETTARCNIELHSASEEEYLAPKLENMLSESASIKFYIINDTGLPISDRELELNEYVSDTSLRLEVGVTLLGHLNLTTYALDVTNISNVNTTILYPEEVVEVSKNLPDNSAFVIEVYPIIRNYERVIEGTSLSFYPILVDYSLVEAIKYFADPVLTIQDLKSLPSEVYKPLQVRFVYSTQQFFYMDATSALADNGLDVLIPNNLPIVGRWRGLTFSIPDGSITLAKLDEEVLEKLNSSIKVTTLTPSVSSNIVLNLDTSDFDYYIIKTPPEDGSPTTINVTATLTNNKAKAILIELQQGTGIIEFDVSLLFPSGNIPVFSGNNKTDLFAVLLTRDGAGIIKKRIFMIQKDIG